MYLTLTHIHSLPLPLLPPVTSSNHLPTPQPIGASHHYVSEKPSPHQATFSNEIRKYFENSERDYFIGILKKRDGQAGKRKERARRINETERLWNRDEGRQVQKVYVREMMVEKLWQTEVSIFHIVEVLHKIQSCLSRQSNSFDHENGHNNRWCRWYLWLCCCRVRITRFYDCWPHTARSSPSVVVFFLSLSLSVVSFFFSPSLTVVCFSFSPFRVGHWAVLVWGREHFPITGSQRERSTRDRRRFHDNIFVCVRSTPWHSVPSELSSLSLSLLL